MMCVGLYSSPEGTIFKQRMIIFSANMKVYLADIKMSSDNVK